MILLMPTVILRHKGKEWALVRVEVNENGEVLDIDIAPSSFKPNWKPFCKATVVDVPGVGPNLAFRMFGQFAQTGEMNADGTAIRTKTGTGEG